ncbi:SAM-dependent methyltransferase [Algoriphagus kandeliae]|uniref:SAM-dependent methyltransferase n=1 Tax=Algoriphagus kandeliae TaxID=2562278 RepID=A0A4Y9QV12_9BACT|nr:class I SAM-dependent methyltransferase [Algoriphagus kandeliae]TFV95970.1 SAM-dependent methyltransferase [Algoriphagus kandeliae]
MTKYLHGYQEEEQRRLYEQAGLLEGLIYPWIDLNRNKNLLELGSGVGGQTEILLKLYPNLSITCVEIEASQLSQAKKNLQAFQKRNIEFIQQDATQLQLDKKFDSAFICWVLEHISDPQKVLEGVFSHLEPHGVIYLTEVFNSSFHFYPKLPGLTDYYQAYNTFQVQNGGNPNIGLQLGNLLHQAGFENILVQPGGFLLDQSQPERFKLMTEYWKKLMLSSASEMVASGLIENHLVNEMNSDLDKISTDPDGIFFYQFIQANAVKP